jgi:hypothetical protein
MKRPLAPAGVLLAAALLLSPAIARAAIPLKTIRVASGLTQPLYVTHPPGDFGRVFIVEKTGRIKILDLQTGAVLATPFLNISTLVSGGFEQGLLGMAFHPDYASNGFFYVNYTDTAGDTVIARYTVSGDPATSNVANTTGTQILSIDQPFANHNGGWIDFGPNDGYLYIATGDGGSACDPGQRAQDITSQLLGKILRIDVDGGSPYANPPSNPFFGATTGDDEIWAYGLRNPFRCGFDQATGDLYIGDVGQDAVEEIDYQPASSTVAVNYGWDCMEGSACSSAPPSSCSPSACTCNAGSLQLPIHEYGHAEGNVVTGGEVYRGCAVSDLGGTYFFADQGSDKIWSFIVVGGAKTAFQDRTAELAPGGGLNLDSISSFGRDAFGEIYLCDLSGGEVFKIVPNTAGPVADCNANLREDACDIRAGSADVNSNGIPDVCEASVPAVSPLGAGVFALILLASGAFAITRSRRRAASPPA